MKVRAQSGGGGDRRSTITRRDDSWNVGNTNQVQVKNNQPDAGNYRKKFCCLFEMIQRIIRKYGNFGPNRVHVAHMKSHREGEINKNSTNVHNYIHTLVNT